MKSIQSAILILAFSATVYLAYTYLINGPNPDGGNASPTNNTGILKTEPEFRNKLAELRMDQNSCPPKKLVGKAQARNH